jgi:hypothetical protein
VFRQQFLQLRVLGLKRFQPFGHRHFHVPILRAPLLKRAIAYAMLPAELLDPYAGLTLLQDAPLARLLRNALPVVNALFFAKTASLHLLSPRLENRLT